MNLYSASFEHTFKARRYGTRSQGISQFYLHTPRSSVNGINHTSIPTFAFSAEAGTHLPTLRDGRLSWPWATGWLNTEINVRRRELNPDTVAHLSINRARRRLTLLVEANALTTTPDRQLLYRPQVFLLHSSSSGVELDLRIYVRTTTART